MGPPAPPLGGQGLLRPQLPTIPSLKGWTVRGQACPLRATQVWRWLGPPTQLLGPGGLTGSRDTSPAVGERSQGDRSQHSLWEKGEASEEERGCLEGPPWFPQSFQL